VSVTGTAITLDLSQSGKTLWLASAASGVTVTIPANASVAFPVGTFIEILTADDALGWMLTGESGVALTASALPISMFGGTSIRLVKTSTNGWYSLGVGVYSTLHEFSSSIADIDGDIGGDLAGGATLANVITAVNKVQDNLREIATTINDARLGIFSPP
jgi:hypothetical protein